jgi:hypothetical protein
MVENFFIDLNEAKRGERIARETLAALTNDFLFEDVSD